MLGRLGLPLGTVAQNYIDLSVVQKYIRKKRRGKRVNERSDRGEGGMKRMSKAY